MTTKAEDDFTLPFAIRNAIAGEVSAHAEKIIEEAKVELEKRICESLAKSVLAAEKYYSVHRNGRELVITVRNELYDKGAQ